MQKRHRYIWDITKEPHISAQKPHISEPYARDLLVRCTQLLPIYMGLYPHKSPTYPHKSPMPTSHIYKRPTGEMRKSATHIYGSLSTKEPHIPHKSPTHKSQIYKRPIGEMRKGPTHTCGQLSAKDFPHMRTSALHTRAIYTRDLLVRCANVPPLHMGHYQQKSLLISAHEPYI